MCEKNPTIEIGSKICGTCRTKLARVTNVPDLDVDSATSPSPSDSESDIEAKHEECESIEVVNQCLIDLGETPVTKKKLQSKKYKERKLEMLTTKMSEVMSVEKKNDESEMLQQLKEKFHSVTKNSEKVQILTVLPKSWSI